MARKFSTLEFEDRWARLVNECGVVENEWVKKLYRRRRLWAEAYLRGNFFAGMRSTQRCEKMNAFLNEYLNEKMRLYEFVRSFDLAIAWLRHTESKAVHTSENTKPVLTTILPELEASAAEVFTRNVFFMVRKHLNRQGLLISEGWSEDGGSRTYYYSKYGGHEISWRVVYDRSMEKLICSCMKFESKGIPCAHMFRVMVVEGMNRIPEACISKRWTKGVYSTNNGMKAFVADEQLTQMARYGTLKSSCNSMCYYASYMDDAFNDLQQMFDKHSVDLKEKWIERGYGGDGFAMDSRVMNDRSRRTFGLLDPRVSRCKGDQKHQKQRRKESVVIAVARFCKLVPYAAAINCFYDMGVKNNLGQTKNKNRTKLVVGNDGDKFSMEAVKRRGDCSQLGFVAGDSQLLCMLIPPATQPCLRLWAMGAQSWHYEFPDIRELCLYQGLP
nr:protein FAR1-RELATED SEQUENCE 5-like [Coffea arabica]